MKSIILMLTSILTSFTLMNPQKESTEYAKPFVDYSAFGKLVQEVEQHRANRLISLDNFLEKSKNPNTVILDARSKAMYDLKHIKGAIHLNFADFTQFSLDEMLSEYAGKDTRILIYCNNNFTDIGNVLELNELKVEDMDPAFISKSAAPTQLSSSKLLPQSSTSQKRVLPQNDELTLALNIPTYINLFGYGYKNVFELDELVDVKDDRIAFEGSFDDL